ncbi:MAG: hypothetical protein JO273_06745, partial [Methylobacteriaceae bacterium]|nr:hypothetical protein [Methylobacteriaceae bacterium]
MRDFGWVEGENLRVDFRYAENDESRMPELAASLSSLSLDVVVAVGPAVFAARPAMPRVPIVAPAAPDPVAMGTVASLARPGNQIAGENLFLTEYVAKRLAYLKEIVPSLTRAAVLLFRGLPRNQDTMQAASWAPGAKCDATVYRTRRRRRIRTRASDRPRRAHPRRRDDRPSALRAQCHRVGRHRD